MCALTIICPRITAGPRCSFVCFGCQGRSACRVLFLAQPFLSERAVVQAVSCASLAGRIFGVGENRKGCMQNGGTNVAGTTNEIMTRSIRSLRSHPTGYGWCVISMDASETRLFDQSQHESTSEREKIHTKKGCLFPKSSRWSGNPHVNLQTSSMLGISGSRLGALRGAYPAQRPLSCPSFID